jgi:uncharacterized protein YjbI with pentapeptide repeats
MSGATATWNSWRGWDLSREPNLTEANLLGADLDRPNLAKAELPRADLSGTNLSGTNLTEADLSGANLAGADLSGVDLSEAILVGAILTGADLSTASLTQEELEPAIGEENTRLPPDLNPPAPWGVKPDEQAKEG